MNIRKRQKLPAVKIYAPLSHTWIELYGTVAPPPKDMVVIPLMLTGRWDPTGHGQWIRGLVR